MRRITKIILGVLIIILIFLWVTIAKSPTTDSLNIYFLNVGQGDAELIQKGDYQILIDGGPDDSILSEIGKIMPITDRRIDIVILTHPHADHLTGINQIIQRYEVGQIYSSGSITTSDQYLNFLNAVTSKNIPMSIPEIGDKISVFGDAELQFLWPGKKYLGISGDNLNNTSEFVRFCEFSHCADFLGDMETDEQAIAYAQLKANNVDYSADLLKISHHGSTNGTNATTLNEINPQVAVIEVGVENKYGHPHAATLDLLNSRNIQDYRTDRDGTIGFSLTPGGISPN
ncbi:MAG: MBL fold metallo-hydrolase [Patescibacteria group bacterium]